MINTEFQSWLNEQFKTLSGTISDLKTETKTLTTIVDKGFKGSDDGISRLEGRMSVLEGGLEGMMRDIIDMERSIQSQIRASTYSGLNGPTWAHDEPQESGAHFLSREKQLKRPPLY